MNKVFKKIKNFFLHSEMDLTSGSTKDLIKKFIIFALPIMFVGILELLYNSFDLIVVQQKNGTIYGAAVGANGSLISLITNAFLGLSTGSNVVMARYYGKNDKEGGERTLHTAYLLSIIGGIIVGVFGFFFAKNLLQLMNVNSDYIDIASSYLRIYFISVPFMMIYNFGASCYRGMGDSFKPLTFLFISGLLNIALNYLFVFGFDLKEKGVALGTVFSQMLSASLVTITLMRNKNGFVKLNFKKLRFYKDELLKIIQIGLPACLGGIMFSISNVLLQSSVNTWPSEVVAANTDAGNIESYTYTCMFSIASATPAFISANLGRGFKENIKKVHIIALCTVVVVGVVIGYSSLALSDYLLRIYMGNNFDAEIVKYAKERMYVVLLTYFLCGLMDTETSVMRGLGYSFIPMIFTFVGCCIFRVAWDLWIYSDDINSSMHSLGVLYMCYPISWLIVFSCQVISYFVIRKKVMKKCDENLIAYNEKHGTKEENKEVSENKEVIENK